MNKKILIVEDEVSLLNALADKLTLEGFGNLQAKNGEDGLKIALKEHPDLILLDILLPKMSGLEMLKKLREDEWGKNAKVIILTNFGKSEDAEEANKYGVIDYLVKADMRIADVARKVKGNLS